MSTDTQPEIGVDRLVRAFTNIRDARAEAKRAWEAKDEELKQGLKQIEIELLKRAQDQNVEGFKTQFGTTYTSEEWHLSISNDDEFFGNIVATQDYDLLERRPSLKRVKEIMAENEGVPPPGIHIFRENRMRVRAK